MIINNIFIKKKKILLVWKPKEKFASITHKKEKIYKEYEQGLG